MTMSSAARGWLGHRGTQHCTNHHPAFGFIHKNYVCGSLNLVMSFQPKDSAYFIGFFSYYYFKLVSLCSLLLPPDMAGTLPAYKVGHFGRFQEGKKSPSSRLTVADLHKARFTQESQSCYFRRIFNTLINHF